MADLNIYEDFEADIYITRRNATTRVIEAATGLSSVVCWFATTPTGTAIGSTNTALTEAGTTGRYVGVIDTATLVTDLAAYAYQTVYLIVSKSGDLGRIVDEYIVRPSGSM